MITQQEYHDLRAERSDLFRSTGHQSLLYHRCLRCGQCELAGGWCSTCGSEEYVLQGHLHTESRLGPVCPLPRDLAYTPPSVIGEYLHLKGASTSRRFRMERKEVSEAHSAALKKARAALSVPPEGPE